MPDKFTKTDKTYSFRICTNCVLPENFPGIKFDDKGVCNKCVSYKRKGNKVIDNRERYQKKFLDLLSQLNKLSKLNQYTYDAIMAFSGGKDSSYTLKILKKDFNLKVLAITFNHGFVSQQALKNIQSVTEALDVDHMMIAPAVNTLKRAFKKSIKSKCYPLKALERASTVCNTCMNLTKSILLKKGIEMGIPLIAYGWSPGQAPIQSSILKLNGSMMRQSQKVTAATLRELMGDEVSSYVLQEKHFEMLEHKYVNGKNISLYNVHPLAFLEYDEKKIVKEIKKLGWKNPEDTDANSTNCLLNSYANQVHYEQYGYHPYAFEVAALVREGFMNRVDGIKKLNAPPDENVIEYVKKRMGIG